MSSDQSGPRRGFQVSISARIIRLTSDSEGVFSPPAVVSSSTYGTFTSRTLGLAGLIAPHRFSHDRHGLGDPGRHRAGGHAEHVRDLLARQSLVVVEDDGGPELGAELGHCLLDHVSRLRPVVVAAGGGPVQAGAAGKGGAFAP